MEEFNVTPGMQHMMEVTLRPNRLKYLVILIVCAGFAVSGALNVAKNSLIGWIEILAFGSNAIVFGVLLLPGSSYLKLDPTGFTICSLFQARTIGWHEVDAFRVGTDRGRKLVVFDFSNLHHGQEFARKFASTISGYEAGLPDTYGLSAEELAATLNEWRERASPPAVSL
jgi:hypothetical protein